jgi:tetratricopeptide (TPR) repeat protein
MKSLLLSFCCFLAALAAPAQSQWSAIMTKNTAGQTYNSFSTLKGLEDFILEQAKKNNVISEVVYGDGKWYGVATYAPVSTKISWNYKEKFPSDWVSEQWKEKKYITKITYGDGNWFVVMTDQTPFLNQSWAKRSSWAEIETFVKEKWKVNSKYNITDLAYGDGLWYVVMSEFKEYEAQSFKDSEDFPDDWIDAKYKDDYNITSIENDGSKWYLVATKQTANHDETIFNPLHDFPAKKIQEKWDGGKRISSLVYVKDEDDISDEEMAELTEYLGSNKEKAAAKLAAKDYPEAIKYYKAAIAEGNAEEVLWNNLAWAKYLNGNCSDALNDVNKAISMNSTSYNNHTKAAILKCQNKCAEAIKYYDEAIRLYRKEHEKFTVGEYYADRADVKRCLGNYSGAIEDIELAMAIEPYNTKLKHTLRELNKLAGNK